MRKNPENLANLVCFNELLVFFFFLLLRGVFLPFEMVVFLAARLGEISFVRFSLPCHASFLLGILLLPADTPHIYTDTETGSHKLHFRFLRVCLFYICIYFCFMEISHHLFAASANRKHYTLLAFSVMGLVVISLHQRVVWFDAFIIN